MAVVLKSLDFKGVRGFSYNSPSSVQFHTSLTLFTGPNGGGKTSIIECLNFVISTNSPPCSDNGKTFVHSKNDNVDGEVKICLEKDGEEFVATKKKNDGSTKVKIGKHLQKKQESKYHKEMLVYFGVDNNSIFKLIMFCHQENSNWFFAERGEVKDGFTNIFGPRISEMKKDLKKKNENVKSLKKDIEDRKEGLKHFETKKKKCDLLIAEMEKIRNNIIDCEAKHQKLLEEIKPIKEEVEKTDMEECIEIEKRIERLETLLCEKEKTITALKTDVSDTFTENIMFGSLEMDVNASIGEIERDEKKNWSILQDLKGKKALFKKERKDHKNDIICRDELIKKLSKKHKISGFDCNEFTDEEVTSFRTKLNGLHEVEICDVQVKIDLLAKLKLEKRNEKERLLQKTEVALKSIPDLGKITSDEFLKWYDEKRKELKETREKYCIMNQKLRRDELIQSSNELNQKDQIENIEKEIMKLTELEESGYLVLLDVMKLDGCNLDIEAYDEEINAEKHKLKTFTERYGLSLQSKKVKRKLAEILDDVKELEMQCEKIKELNREEYEKDVENINNVKREIEECKQKKITIQLKEKNKIMKEKEKEETKLKHIGQSQENLDRIKDLQEKLNTSIEKEAQAKTELKQMRQEKHELLNKYNTYYANAEQTLLSKKQEFEDYAEKLKRMEEECEKDNCKINAYHKTQLEKINKDIKKYWNKICHYSDIEIECTGTDVYKVCMRESQHRLDMRTQCSTGQRALASVIIRLALLERFCSTCKILALDEPTALLDDNNTRRLTQVLKDFQSERGVQLIVISRDSNFIAALQDVGLIKTSYKVFKDQENLHSTVALKTPMSNFVKVKTDETSSEEELMEGPPEKKCRL